MTAPPARCNRCRVALSSRTQDKIAAGKPVSGLCGQCWTEAHRRPKPQCRDCGNQISIMSVLGRCRACAAVVRESDPEFRERRLAAVRASTQRPEVLAVKQRVARENGSKHLAWCPAEYRERYQLFRKTKHMGSSEAKRLILAQITADRQPSTFEEQLARVAAGEVRVVAKPVMPRREPEMTLGGVADWGSL